MKKLITIFTLILSVFIYSQDAYQNGFSAGYKSGYCYNILGCVSPAAPIGYRDVNNNYQTGYNNGFVKGQQDQVSQNSSYNTGGVKGQIKPAISDLDLNIDPNNMRQMWADYYEKRKIKKQAKLDKKNRQNEILAQIITDKTIEIAKEMDKLKDRLKSKNINDKEIENIIYDLHYENQTIYNQYKIKPEKYSEYYDEYLKLKNKILNM
ncbi:hypothetical protein QFZ37_002283 [Chryseobacterium ginsenosidimutans]|uniref:hypothetical protein n=1 Tax=Chryseobacterium ginsenosidimutans TaxID=687846 RepID=UPI00277F90E2|nr:hypothetical protein [Chryseobacterium ginsenosidimutans]MDQ0593569.1 hypothetical protein [Chryseobacterium ginsenosidimutans]MDQ0593914.1 hypothetical protein [Chryseobacterium ginsenosidimutans]